MATVITGFTVSLVLGVPIGTFLAGHFDWHYIFLIIALGTVFFNNRTLQIITIHKRKPTAAIYTTATNYER